MDMPEQNEDRGKRREPHARWSNRLDEARSVVIRLVVAVDGGVKQDIKRRHCGPAGEIRINLSKADCERAWGG